MMNFALNPAQIPRSTTAAAPSLTLFSRPRWFWCKHEGISTEIRGICTNNDAFMLWYHTSSRVAKPPEGHRRPQSIPVTTRAIWHINRHLSSFLIQNPSFLVTKSIIFSTKSIIFSTKSSYHYPEYTCKNARTGQQCDTTFNFRNISERFAAGCVCVCVCVCDSIFRRHKLPLWSRLVRLYIYVHEWNRSSIENQDSFVEKRLSFVTGRTQRRSLPVNTPAILQNPQFAPDYGLIKRRHVFTGMNGCGITVVEPPAPTAAGPFYRSMILMVLKMAVDLIELWSSTRRRPLLRRGQLGAFVWLKNDDFLI